jgi:hypothetical protein
VIRVLARLLAIAFMLLASQAALAREANFPAPLVAEIEAAKESMMADQREALYHAGRIDVLARKLTDGRQRALAVATARWLAAEASLRSNAIDRVGPLLTEGLLLVGSVGQPIKLRGDLLMSQGAFYMQQDNA